MGDFSDQFLKAVNEQNDLLNRICKTNTFSSLRNILYTDSLDSYKLIIRHIPFYRWVDDCFTTVHGFDPLSITIEKATWVRYCSELFTNKNISRRKLQNWVYNINIILEPFAEHQLINFIRSICDYCMTFPQSTNKTRTTLSEQISEHSLTWVIEFAQAIGTLLVSDGSVKEFHTSILCLAPNILWLIFVSEDLSGAKFARGVEIIQNTVKFEGRIVEDEAVGHLLQTIRRGNLRNEYTEIPDDVHTHSEPMIVRDITNMNIDGVVLPTPPTVLMKSKWTIAANAGSTVSLILMQMLKSANGIQGLTIDTNTGTVVTGRLCARVSWNELCGFHFWPFISDIVEQRPEWNITRKQSFMSSLSYYNGGDKNLAKFITEESWWPFLPCLDTDVERTRSEIVVPLNKTYTLWEDFTFPNRHPIWQNTPAFISVVCARRYEDCMCWLLEQMYQRAESKKDAQRLHPLLRDEYVWTRLTSPPHITEETKEEVLFRVLHPVAEIGGNRIEECLKSLSPN